MQLVSSQNVEMYFAQEYIALQQNQKDEWEDAPKVYCGLLTVEFAQQQDTKQCFLDWYCLQTLLVFLEYCRLKQFAEATNRAKGLADFLLANERLMPAMKTIFPQSISRLQFLAQVFFEIGESIFFEKVQTLWNC